MWHVKPKLAATVVGALAIAGIAVGPAAANPDNSGSPPSALSLSYLSGPQSQAFWLGSVAAGSELDVGDVLAGPYNAGAPYGGGYAKIVLQNFPSLLPTQEPTFDFSGADLAGELRWYIQFTGPGCQQTASGQVSPPTSPQYENAPCYVFGYPSPVTADGTGGAPFNWEVHDNGVTTYGGWSTVLGIFGSQPVNNVRIVADNSGQNAPFTDTVTNVEYAGAYPTP